MSYCCGQSVDTPYCPQCGRPAPVNVLDELARYCLARLRQVESQAESHKEERPDSPAYTQKRGRLMENAAKWRRWVEAINQAVIDTQ